MKCEIPLTYSEACALLGWTESSDAGALLAWKDSEGTEHQVALFEPAKQNLRELLKGDMYLGIP